MRESWEVPDGRYIMVVLRHLLFDAGAPGPAGPPGADGTSGGGKCCRFFSLLLCKSTPFCVPILVVVAREYTPGDARTTDFPSL